MIKETKIKLYRILSKTYIAISIIFCILFIFLPYNMPEILAILAVATLNCSILLDFKATSLE